MTRPAPNTRSDWQPRRWLVVGFAATLVVIALAIVHYVSEVRMMNEFGPDAQMGIWVMVSAVVHSVWTTIGVAVGLALGVAWGSRARVAEDSGRAPLRAGWWGHPLLRGVTAALVACWVVGTVWSTWQLERGRQTLADAADPTTSAARLLELVDFRGRQAGYELDNRIAAHPNADETARARLAARGNTGTLQILARRRSTVPGPPSAPDTRSPLPAARDPSDISDVLESFRRRSSDGADPRDLERTNEIERAADAADGEQGVERPDSG